MTTGPFSDYILPIIDLELLKLAKIVKKLSKTLLFCVLLSEVHL